MPKPGTTVQYIVDVPNQTLSTVTTIIEVDTKTTTQLQDVVGQLKNQMVSIQQNMADLQIQLDQLNQSA